MGNDAVSIFQGGLNQRGFQIGDVLPQVETIGRQRRERITQDGSGNNIGSRDQSCRCRFCGR